MKTLHLAKDLKLPLDAVTQTLAAIGRKGAGKTYLATMIAEQMLDAEAQVICLDAVGNWWGLRVGADGKSKGKEIFVLGGDHGDVALVPEAGARIARFIVEKGASAVLDISGFRLGERKRFAADFGEELLHLKKAQRSPVHLFIEEAQLLIPQRVGPEEARMVGAFEQLVRLGRNYGIGCTLVTQRPQSVNKEVLSQVECLCVLQVTGPHERKALEEWVQEVGADRKLVGELPGLGRGEGYVWSPSWLRIYQRVKFGTKTTFDASATPEVGKAARAASLSAVDVEALRADLVEVVKWAEKDDPKALRRRIAELERLVAAAAKSRPGVVAAAKVERVQVPVLKDVQVKRLEAAITRFEKAAAGVGAAVLEMRPELARAVRPGPGAVPMRQLRPLDGDQPRPAGSPGRVYPGAGAAWAPPPAARAPATAARRVDARPPPVGGLDKAQRAILAVLAQHPDGCEAGKLTLLAGYRWSGGFRNALSALRSAGYIDGGNTGTMKITDGGLAALGNGYEPLPAGRGLVHHWLHHPSFGACERAVLQALLAHPAGLDADGLISALDGAYTWSGGFRNALSNLRTAGVLVGRNGEVMRASEELL